MGKEWRIFLFKRIGWKKARRLDWLLKAEFQIDRRNREAFQSKGIAITRRQELYTRAAQHKSSFLNLESSFHQMRVVVAFTRNPIATFSFSFVQWTLLNLSIHSTTTSNCNSKDSALWMGDSTNWNRNEDLPITGRYRACPSFSWPRSRKWACYWPTIGESRGTFRLYRRYK